jgi:hypothetical protein
MADGGGPPEQCLRYGMPSHSEAPNGGARALGYLGLFQVTRCKSETASRRTAKTDMPPIKKHSSPKNRIYIQNQFWILTIFSPLPTTV